MYQKGNRFVKPLTILGVVLLLLCIYFTKFREEVCTYDEEDIACHNSTLKVDLLPYDPWNPLNSVNVKKLYQLVSRRAVERSNYDHGGQTIFFHETSCRGHLTPRQACAVESAARAHPSSQIHVLLSAPVEAVHRSDAILYRIDRDNVFAGRVLIEDYVKGTPLEGVVSSGMLQRSRYPYSWTSLVLRFATLFRHPGLYLDLDCIVVKPLNLNENFATRLDDSKISSSVLSFTGDDVGRRLAEDAARLLAETMDDDKLNSTDDTGVMMRAVNARCSKQTRDKTKNACDNNGIKIYPPAFASPISWVQSHQYFEQATVKTWESPATHIHHLNSRITKCSRTVGGCLLNELAKKFCPNVYERSQVMGDWR